MDTLTTTVGQTTFSYPKAILCQRSKIVDIDPLIILVNGKPISHNTMDTFLGYILDKRLDMDFTRPIQVELNEYFGIAHINEHKIAFAAKVLTSNENEATILIDDTPVSLLDMGEFFEQVLNCQLGLATEIVAAREVAAEGEQ